MARKSRSTESNSILTNITTNPAQFATEERLRAQAAQLSRQLADAKHRTIELVNAVYRAASDAITDLNIPPVPRPERDGRSKDAEYAVALASDWQLGKKTPTYNTGICEARVYQHADKVIKFANIQRADHPVRECRVYFLGDMIEGELIFPGQAHRIDSSLYRQVCVDGPRIAVGFIRRLLTSFDKVHVVCVIGNHGAIGGKARKEMHPESNADLFLYKFVETLFRETGENRVTFHIPFTEGEKSWYAVDVMGDFRMFLAHGYQMTKGSGGWAGLPHYGFARAIAQWASGVIPEEFNAAAIGHWHQLASLPFNNRILWVNGSTESGNEWLREEVKAQSPPGQYLLFCHPKKGITSEHRLWLT